MTDGTGPWILSKEALLSMLTVFGTKMGMDAAYANVMGQVFLAQSPLHKHWHSFTVKNCVGCAESPDDCRYLNPKKEDVAPGRSAVEFKASVVGLIGLGRTQDCPFRQTSESFRQTSESLTESLIREVPAGTSPEEKPCD